MDETYYEAVLRLRREALWNYYMGFQFKADQRLIQERIERDGRGNDTSSI